MWTAATCLLIKCIPSYTGDAINRQKQRDGEYAHYILCDWNYKRPQILRPLM